MYIPPSIKRARYWMMWCSRCLTSVLHMIEHCVSCKYIFTTRTWPLATLCPLDPGWTKISIGDLTTIVSVESPYFWLKIWAVDPLNSEHRVFPHHSNWFHRDSTDWMGLHSHLALSSHAPFIALIVSSNLKNKKIDWKNPPLKTYIWIGSIIDLQSMFLFRFSVSIVLVVIHILNKKGTLKLFCVWASSKVQVILFRSNQLTIHLL